MNKDYYVAMLIDDVIVPSSVIAHGTLRDMQDVVKRMMRKKERHESVSWQLFPCVSTK